MVSELLDTLTSKHIKEFLGRIATDCFSVMNSKEFPIAGIIVMILHSQLLERIVKGEEDTDRTGCLSLMGLLMNRMIVQLDELPTVSYETLEGSAEQTCDVCKSTINQAIKFIIEKRTSNEFVVCRECCIVSPKSKQSSKLLMNLLPLVLGSYHDSFEAD
jgi:hypothetical protein